MYCRSQLGIRQLPMCVYVYYNITYIQRDGVSEAKRASGRACNCETSNRCFVVSLPLRLVKIVKNGDVRSNKSPFRLFSIHGSTFFLFCVFLTTLPFSPHNFIKVFLVSLISKNKYVPYNMKYDIFMKNQFQIFHTRTIPISNRYISCVIAFF